MNAMMQRFFEASGCRTQIELAEFLNIRQSSVSDAKRRQVIPADWLITLLRRKNINPDWILTGAEPRFLLPAESLGGHTELLPHVASKPVTCTFVDFQGEEEAGRAS